MHQAFVLMMTAPSVTQGLSNASHVNWLMGKGGAGGVAGGEGSGGRAAGTKASSGSASSARATVCCRWWDAGYCRVAQAAKACASKEGKAHSRK